MENGDETLVSPTAAAATAEKTAPNGGVAEEEVTVTAHAHAHPAKSYAAVAAEKTAPNGSAAEEEGVTVTAPKSYAEVAAEKTSPNGSAAEEEEEEDTVTAPKSYAAVAAENTSTNGSTAEEEVTVAAPRSYAAVAANAEIEDLRATKLDLEDKLATAEQENKTLAAETYRLEGVFSQAREEVTTAEYAAATSDEVVVSLRDEVKHLQDLLKAEKGDHEEDKRNSEQLAAKVESERKAKLTLEQEIEDLKKKKAAAADTTLEEREADPAAGPPEEAAVPWPGMAAAAAAGVVATAAVLLLYLRLKR